MIKKNNIEFILILLISFTFLIFTTNFFNFKETIIYGAVDGKTYMQIAEASPNISTDELIFHKAQRFLIPYMVGFFSYFLSIEEFTMFRLFSFLFILLSILIFSKISNLLNFDKTIKYFLFCFFCLNPYVIRYFVSLPTLINDLVFIFSGFLLLLAALKENKLYLYLSIFLSSASRINAIFFIISIIFTKVFFKKKFNFSLLDILISIIIFLVINFINNYHANLVGIQNGAYDIKIRFGLFFSKYTINEFLIFIIFPLLNFIPLVLVPFYFNIRFKVNDLFKDKIFFLSISIIFLIYFIAFVAGPEITGKNITRLINLSMPFIIYSLYKILKVKKKEFTKSKIIILLLFTGLWSLHPTYSNISLFEPLSIWFKN